MYYNFIKAHVLENFRKEYFCHLIYVEKVALELQQRLWWDKEIIQISSIWHDIGRVEWWDNSSHAEKWSEQIYNLLLEKWYGEEKSRKVARCTLMHNKVSWFESLEEEIVSNADTLSKLIFHEMFMLMCRKDDYIAKASWWLKYVEKWYNNLTFDFLKKEYRGLYEELKMKYEIIII